MDDLFFESQDSDQLKRVEAWSLNLYSVQHFDEAIKSFCAEVYEGLQARSVLFFKYLKNYSSIMITHSEGISFSEVRSMGLNFSQDPQFNPVRDFLRIKQNPSFLELMRKISPHHDFSVSLCVVAGEVRGLFVFADVSNGALERPYYKICERITSHWLSEISLLEEIHNITRYDQATGLYNKKFFTESLALEVGRAQRIKQPVSLVVIRVDGSDQLKAKLNKERYSSFLRMVAQHLLSSTRKTDYVSVLSDSEFAIMFPHMNLFYLRQKVLKLKLLLESTKYFEDFNFKSVISFSFCLSEYPALAHDFEDLILSTTQKLMLESAISSVTEVRPPKDFEPDFKT